MKAVVFAIALMAAAPLVNAGETKGMDHNAMSHDHKPQGVHKTVGVVKKLDPKAGTATLAHEPIKSLNWPAMTMAFKVQDKAAFDKLAEGKKVEVEFEQRGKDYVITSVK
ncbi:MAG: copper-binding protein [Burkholderiales bacterium]